MRASACATHEVLVSISPSLELCHLSASGMHVPREGDEGERACGCGGGLDTERRRGREGGAGKPKYTKTDVALEMS